MVLASFVALLICLATGTGLPDGIFSKQHPNLGIYQMDLQWRMWTYFLAIWYILWFFGIYFPVLVRCVKKNLATLHGKAECLNYVGQCASKNCEFQSTEGFLVPFQQLALQTK
jgi:hypothetical protein